MTKLRYGAVLFDLDGTLVDSYAALAEAVNFARREHGRDDLPAGRVRDFVGEGLDTLLQRAFEVIDVPASVRAAFETRYDEICCTESRILAGVEPTLAALSSLGVTMAVCTNKPTAFSRKILEYLRLTPHFRAVVGPDLAGARKPDGMHVRRTLEEAGCSGAAAVLVGDMPIDVQAAHSGGIAAAVVPSGSSSREELIAARPDHLLERFSDVLSLVANGAGRR